MTNSAATVKIALMLAGITQAEIADQCGVAPNTVNAVVHGRSRSRKVENRITTATGVSREQLWPQWYGPNAVRRRKPVSGAEIARRLAAFTADPARRVA